MASWLSAEGTLEIASNFFSKSVLDGDDCVPIECPVAEVLDGNDCAEIECPVGEVLDGHDSVEIECPVEALI